MTSELFSSVYKEKSDHLFDDRIFSCPVPAFTHWSIFVPLSENPLFSSFFRILGLFLLAYELFPTVTFRLIWGEFLGDFARFASFFSVFSVFSARLVLFWYQSLVSIF